MFKLDNKIELENKSNDVLTVGELLIDMISADYDEHFECGSYNKYFGGSPSNIAMSVKKLGINSLVASAVGKDGFGDFLIRHLKDSAIDTGCVQKVDYATSMVVVTKSKSTPVPIFYRGADFHLYYTPELRQAVKNSKIVHFSCWPISRLPSRNTVEQVMEEAVKNRVLLCFDPNYHPLIWPKEEDGIEYVKSVLRRVDIVKPSEDDAERLFGKDTHENQIKKFLSLGAKLVILTIGKDGAIISNGTETVRLNSLATEIADTTGAGDAFWSGFYAAIVRGDTLYESLRMGMAVSAYKLKYTGAVVDLPPLDRIKEIYRT